MIKVSARELRENVWHDIDVPEAMTEQIEFLKSKVNTDTVFRLDTTNANGVTSTIFYCCKEKFVAGLREKFKNATVQTAEDALLALDFCPELYLTSIRLFCTPKDVEVAFPEMPDSSLSLEQKKDWWKEKTKGKKNNGI